MNKQVPVKNYFILGIVALITILLTYYIVSWYQTNEQYQKDSTILSTVLSEVKEKELEDYLVDNPNILVYVVDSRVQHRTFEKEFKEYILENNLSKNIVYINYRNVSNKFTENLKKQASEELLQENPLFLAVPNILVFEEQKLVDILYSKKENPNMQDIRNLMENYRD